MLARFLRCMFCCRSFSWQGMKEVFREAIGAGIALSAAVVLVLRSRSRRGRALSELEAFCLALPKVELHAHLHGCARLSTIAELAPSSVDTSILTDDRGVCADRSLSACFDVFGAIHKTVTSLAAVRRIAREVLDDFAADNVKYLELRTTPRELSDADAEGYVRAVLRVFAEFERDAARARTPWPLTVRLLLSIDRTGGPERAAATVSLASRLRAEPGGDGAKFIVGVDFSGNPTKGSFAQYAEAFESARRAGLRVAVHVAEVESHDDTTGVIQFRPDRLGHALILSAEHVSTLAARPIPIELCPTSNLKTLGLRSLADHPTMSRWLGSRYPISISTDDSTVFGTTPSRELALVVRSAGARVRARADLWHAPEPERVPCAGVLLQVV